MSCSTHCFTNFHKLCTSKIVTVRAPLLPTVCILFTRLLKSKNVFSRGFFLKILALGMVSIQERFLIKSQLQWRAYGERRYEIRILIEKLFPPIKVMQSKWPFLGFRFFCTFLTVRYEHCEIVWKLPSHCQTNLDFILFCITRKHS